MSLAARAKVPSMKRFRAISVATFLSLSAASVATFVPADARASVSIAILFDELVERSSAAGVVTPVEQHAVWEDGRIYTYTRVHVDSTVAGSVPGEAWVRTMGGVVGKVGQSVEGEAVLTVGRPALLFLQPIATPSGTVAGAFEVTARAQGQFAVTLDATKSMRFTRAYAASAVLPPPAARIARVQAMRPGAAPLATEVLHDRPVDQATRDIQSAWTRLHPPPPSQGK